MRKAKIEFLLAFLFVLDFWGHGRSYAQKADTSAKVNLLDGSVVRKYSLKKIIARAGENYEASLPEKFEHSKVYFGGVYRMTGYTSTLTDGFSNHMTNPTRILIRDPFNEPILFLNAGASVSDNAYFGTQFRFFNSFSGPGVINGDALSINFGLTVGGVIKSKVGVFEVVMGGIQWSGLSPFTIGNGSSYPRNSVFDRPSGAQGADIVERYNNYYNNDPYKNLPGYGGRSFNGINLKATKLPAGFDFNLLYGKTDNNGGFNSHQRPYTPTQLVGARLIRNHNGSMYGLNVFQNLVYSSTVNSPRSGYDINTAEFKLNFGDFLTFGEIGFGSYGSQTYERQYSEAINIHFNTKAGITGIPLDLHFFQLGENFVNLNGAFSNTTVPEAQQTNSAVLANQSFNISGNPIPKAGMMNNNMRGITGSTRFSLGQFRFDFSYSASTELNRITDRISYSHRISGLALSRFNNGSRGPYNRLTPFFNSFYTTLTVNDPDKTADGILPFHKQYNSVEGQVKYKTKIFSRELFVFANGGSQSVGSQQSPFLSNSSSTLVRFSSLEAEAFYNIRPALTISIYGGYERSVASEATTLNTYNLDDAKTPPTNKPSNQIGSSVAFGLDYAISGSTGIYLRQRWFDYKDINFPDEKFKGFETTLELKAVFW